jgi:propanol-preferring alcohol dehydrogenase
MKAVQITAIGEPLAERTIDTPSPGPGEVLVAVRAAGICHSDAHYRSGVGTLAELPITPGHEVAGVIEAVGAGVEQSRIGERVCLHYLVTCGECSYCERNLGQFCVEVAMIGKDRHGGYAEYIVVPAANAIPLPVEIPFNQAAVMMCSFATTLHALRKARFVEGESVAVFGAGGLGTAAILLASALGASTIMAVDHNLAKIDAAEALGAVGIDASSGDVVEAVFAHTGGQGADVGLELVGLPVTSDQALRSLGVGGRAAIVGLSSEPTTVDMYRDIIGKEREIIGVSDHLVSEIHELIDLVQQGKLDITPVVSGTVPLDATAVNAVFDNLDGGCGSAIRTVITVC